MGVPNFFGWFTKIIETTKAVDINKVFLTKVPDNIDNFYIDANSLFHLRCYSIYSDPKNRNISEERLEELMVERIVENIKSLIKYVNPKGITYIAVDGVVPMGKVRQQRSRRYKKLVDEKKYSEFMKKAGVSVRSWNTTKISPGTEFMKKLSDGLEKYSSKEEKVEFSSPYEPGEGEHKILNRIRTEENDKKRIIYGMDSDLIFLSMIMALSGRPNIFIMRDNCRDVAHNDELVISKIENLDVSLSMYTIVKYLEMQKKYGLKKKADSPIKKKINNDGKIDKSIYLIDDFIFLMFFIGNDFIPHPPSIDIKGESIYYLLYSYFKISKSLKSTLILVDRNKNDVKINFYFLELLAKDLSISFNKNQSRDFVKEGKEDYFFKNILPKIVERSKNFFNKQLSANLFQIKNEKDEEKKKYLEFERMKIIYESGVAMNYDDLGMMTDERKYYGYQYYNRHFYPKINKQKKDDICKNYLKTFIWTLNYYYFKCISWTWYYPFEKAPFLSDFYYYLKRRREKNDNKIYFNCHGPINIDVQMMLITPALNVDLLRKDIQKYVTSIDSPIIDLFPVEFEIEESCEYTYWKCYPKIPRMNFKRITEVLENSE